MKNLSNEEAVKIKEQWRKKYAGARYSVHSILRGDVMDEKLCKNCIYCQGTGWMVSACVRTKTEKNLVMGDSFHSSCLKERSYNWLSALLFGKCGGSGRYFARKPFNPPRVNEQERKKGKG